MKHQHQKNDVASHRVVNPLLDQKVRETAVKLREMGSQDPLKFWAEMSRDIEWSKNWEKVFDGSNTPFYRWFLGGQLNASYNCIDRHLAGWRRNKAAIIFEDERGETRVLTYQDLYREVNRLASGLKKLGVKRGEVVTIYMPMIPESVIAMLACARIGAPHSVVFGGFSADALRDRIQDASSRFLITADGGMRRGKSVPLKQNVDIALGSEKSPVEKVIVARNTGDAVPMQQGRDLWFDDVSNSGELYCEPERMDAEDPLFILYSSGTTGKPKGILHTTGGYMIGVHTTYKYTFDHREEDIYWCTADIGWITGHSYIVYAPLSNGATVVLYEGSPDYPSQDRFWSIIEKYRVSVFYTAPTAIRLFIKWGDQWPASHDLSSLRLLGSVGEPINPEVWLWYYKHIGGEKCPVMDTWWQTETGMFLITPLPGDESFVPGAATCPFPGVDVAVLNEQGEPAETGEQGYLVVRKPWPAMFRTLYKDEERYLNTYWSQYKGIYFTGDGAKQDEEGAIWVIGRIDDVINVSGHRIGTAEIESVLVEHEAVAEAAVIGKKHEIKGQAIAAFVTLKEGHNGSEELDAALKKLVAGRIGALARPEEILFSAELPKTRSGKIIRRLLRDIAEGKIIGDTTTLMDPQVVSSIKEKYGSMES
ncbi:MAG TPA: acetate--CoA ligase [Firmicutes bacterium]|nr:acetate--CoA ligase [Bacillota bacterium]